MLWANKKRAYLRISLLIVILDLSCSHGSYYTGDKLYKKREYSAAIENYKRSLAKKNTKQSEKAILKYKIGDTLYMMGEKSKALETLRGVTDLTPPFLYNLLNLKIRILNELGQYQKDQESIDLLEGLEGKDYMSQEIELDTFYEGLRNLYYLNSIRSGDRFLIKGNLKRDLGDIYAALEYYKMALRSNPEEEDYLITFTETFKLAVDNVDSKFNKKQIGNFYSHYYPLFFSFLSELYFKNPKPNITFSDRIKEEFLALTNKFKNAKLARPLPIYSNIIFQNQNTLIQTFIANEPIKILKIDQMDEKSPYIIFSPKDMLIGISEVIDSSYFIEEK